MMIEAANEEATDAPPPPVEDLILTEGGDNITTEDSDKLKTEDSP